MLTSLINKLVRLFECHRWLVWFCLFAAMAAISITLWSYEDGEPRPPRIPKPDKPIAFSVSFHGYSNSPSGQWWGILIVTNRDFGDLCFANPMIVELADHPGDAQDTHWKTPDFIPPRSFDRIAVEIPATPGAWRARCIIARSTWRDPLRDALSSRGWPNSLLPLRRTRRMEGLVTEWITNQPMRPLSTDVKDLKKGSPVRSESLLEKEPHTSTGGRSSY